MKHPLLAAAIFAGVAHLLSAAPHITIGDLKLVRVATPGPTAVKLRQYLPEGEVLERWNRMASVRVFKNEKDPLGYLEVVAAAVRKSDPTAHAEFFRQKKTSEMLLDFIIFSPPNSPAPFAEWNMMRAKLVPGLGLVVYQYAMRLYEVTESSIRSIGPERRKMMTPFIQATFEEKTETGQPVAPDDGDGP